VTIEVLFDFLPFPALKVLILELSQLGSHNNFLPSESNSTPLWKLPGVFSPPGTYPRCPYWPPQGKHSAHDDCYALRQKADWELSK
jgi:hypothetical protein